MTIGVDVGVDVDDFCALESLLEISGLVMTLRTVNVTGAPLTTTRLGAFPACGVPATSR